MGIDVKIKICGVKTPEIAEVAVESGADMIGVVFVKKSPRYVTIEQACVVGEAIGERANVVGLFVDADSAHIKACVSNANLTMLQLHGSIDTEEIAAYSPVGVLRATAFDVNTTATELRKWDRAYSDQNNLRGLVIDTPDPSKVGGGTGKSFDWEELRKIIDEVELRVPVILAGGLTPENVGKAIRIVRPFGVDVSSGVEWRRGEKDAGKIREFCEAVRSVSNEISGDVV